jgi:hypothetical protein
MPHHDGGVVRAVKTVGSSGQIALGKQYAGRPVLIEQVEPGVWVIKLGSFVPDNERWLHAPEVAAQLDAGLAWAAENPPQATDLDQLEEQIRHASAPRSRRAGSK